MSLINGLFESFTTAVYERFEKMDERMERVEEKVDRVEEKVDRVVEKVGRVEEEVGGVLKVVEVQPEHKRESWKSKHVISPYTIVTYGKKRKTKKKNEKFRESGEAKMEGEGKEEGGGSGEVKVEEGEVGREGSGEVKIEEEGGESGQVKREELKVDLYGPIDEENKKFFYAYYNDSRSDRHVKCKTRDYPREWFEKMLTIGRWLDDSMSYFPLFLLMFSMRYCILIMLFLFDATHR